MAESTSVTTVKADPGTSEALRNGCICPIYNHQPIKPKQPVLNRFNELYLTTPTCPVHGWR